MNNNKTSRKQKKIRKSLKKVLKGSGDYSILDLKSINDLDRRLTKFEQRQPKTPIGLAAHLAGSTLGGLVGQSDLGGQAATALAKWFGHGDYDVKVNSLIPNANGTMPRTGLVFDSDGRRGFRITEREYIGDIFSGSLVSGTSVFTNQSYFLNPGNSALFPWLSSIAHQFEQYKPNGIIFEFKSTSSAYNGTTQALGTIITATDYDPSDAPYFTKIEMENSDYAKSCKAADSLMHGVECDLTERGDRVLLVRTGDVGTESLKFFDLGTFQIATMGMSAANVNLGELWVSYDFTFYKKQLTQGQIGNDINTFALSTTSSTTANYLTLPGFLRAGNLNVTVNANTLFFPPNIVTGRYIVTFFFLGTSVVTPNLIPFTSCSFIDPFGPSIWSNVNFATPWSSTTSSTGLATYFVRITGPNASVQFTGGTLTGATLQLMINQVPLTNLARIQ